MSYPGYPNSDPSYPPYPNSGFPQESGYPPNYESGFNPGYNNYTSQPNVGFNVGYPPMPTGYPPQSGPYPPPLGAYPPPAGAYPQVGVFPPQPGFGGGPTGYPMAPGYPQPYPPGAPNPAIFATTMSDAVHPSAPYNPGHPDGALALAGAQHVTKEVHEERKEEKKEVKKDVHDEKKEIHEEKKEIHEEKKEIHEEKKIDECIEKLEKEIIQEKKVNDEIHKDENESHGNKKEYEDYETVEVVHTEGTVKEHHPFEPKEDAAALKKAMKGLGTKEKVIIDILANRTYEQREKIAVEFKTSFGKDLVSQLKKELGGHLEDAILALMTPREKYLAECLHSAISGAGTKDRVLIEILCTATNSEIHKINSLYNEAYGKTLEKAIAGDTSGYFQNLMVAIDVGNRDDSKEISREKAKKDAEAMHQAGEKKMGTDESVFTKILVSQSYPQLRITFEEYEKLYNHSIEDALKKEMSGKLLNAMLALVGCIKNKEKFFAEQLNEAIKGMGTKDHTLIRLIVTRSEIDLKEIKEEFQKNYKKTLEAVVKSEAGGDYRKVLQEIIK